MCESTEPEPQCSPPQDTSGDPDSRQASHSLVPQKKENLERVGEKEPTRSRHLIRVPTLPPPDRILASFTPRALSAYNKSAIPALKIPSIHRSRFYTSRQRTFKPAFLDLHGRHERRRMNLRPFCPSQSRLPVDEASRRAVVKMRTAGQPPLSQIPDSISLFTGIRRHVEVAQGIQLLYL